MNCGNGNLAEGMALQQMESVQRLSNCWQQWLAMAAITPERGGMGNI